MSTFVRKPPPFSAPGDDLLSPGRRADNTGWVDPGVEYDGLRGPIHPMISAEAFRQVAFKHPQLRLVDRADFDRAAANAAEGERWVAELRAENAKLHAELDAIAGLRKSGFTVQKIKGPRPKETV